MQWRGRDSKFAIGFAFQNKGEIMLRTMLAALAMTAALASAGLAGDCACGSGMAYGGGGGIAAWDGYCGCGGNACGSCGGGGGCGCRRCVFPILHCALHKVGRVVDAILPDP